VTSPRSRRYRLPNWICATGVERSPSRMERGLRKALMAENRRREKGRHLPSGPEGVDVVRLARDKATPMVRAWEGLGPTWELAPLRKSGRRATSASL